MANYGSATPTDITRYIGLVDQDDPTNLPPGCAATCYNCRFSLTSVETRWGIGTAIQGKNKSPITGLMGCAYTPEAAEQQYFQAPLLFDYLGTLQIESPVGTGRTTPITGDLVTLPANSHMIGTQAANRAWMAFSNLMTSTSPMAVYDLFTKTLVPYGMKPVGFGWYAGAMVLEGEVVTPSKIVNGVTVAQSNGHTYQCIQAGVTGNIQPIWPLTENAQFNDGTARWEEYTPVLANRLPNAATPVLTDTPGGGAFAAGRDVYIMLTLMNDQGEALTSVPAVFGNTAAADAINVPIPALASLPKWVQGLPTQYAVTGVNVYEADVATGAPAPPQSEYEQVGNFALGTTAVVTTTATSGTFPPTLNTARITSGMLPAPVIQPVLTRDSAGGTFPVGRDVYVLQTYTNRSGETTPGPANSIIDTQANDAVQVEIDGLATYEITGVNLYAADVATGQPPPPATQFAFVGSFQPGATATIATSAVGQPPPVVNSTGAAGNIAADTLNSLGVMGQRYAVIAFKNSLGTVSGIVVSAVVGYVVDESGFELAMFNIFTGPSNIVAREVGFTVADGTIQGPFYVIPSDITSAGVMMTSTVIPDNTTTSAVFNFTDSFLLAENTPATNITDRLRVIAPQPAVDAYYCASIDRIIQTGVPGFYSGHWISLAADYESYYGDSSDITVGNNDGERAICAREFRDVIYSLRERSGFVIGPSTADPDTWSVQQRWSKVGPCGPRAVDVCGEFLIFVHSSGIYRYTVDYPELVTKEIPRWWNTINWAAQETISCAIDVEQHEVHFLFPVNGSTVPNQELVLNYEEGWNNPLLFSRYSGKEMVIEQARKYSVNNIAGFVCGRFYRTVLGTPDPQEGPVDFTQASKRDTISQFLYSSSGPDGTVQAILPGIYNDNGAAIDCQYETTSIGQMQTLSHLQGVNLNVRGVGELYVSFIPGARLVTDWKPGDKVFEVKLRPFELELTPSKGLSRNTPPKLNEKWRMRVTNGNVADSWFALKEAIVYTSSMFQGREANE
jgi:hypothetical protein